MRTIIGIGHRQYVNKTGKQVSGYNVYVTYEDKNTSGLCCEREWVNDEIMESSGVAVGDTVEFLYNKYGRVDSIRPC